jgi:hypothetical protein
VVWILPFAPWLFHRNCLVTFLIFVSSFGLVKSYDMPCNVESASLEPKFGNKFVAGGEDMWIHVFDFHTGEQIGMCNCTKFFFFFFEETSSTSKHKKLV